MDGRTQSHHARLAEHMTAWNGYGWLTPLAPVDALVQAQASIMSDLDIVWVLGIIALVVWPAVLPLPGVPQEAARRTGPVWRDTGARSVERREFS
jgi:hypothetical protein